MRTRSGWSRPRRENGVAAARGVEEPGEGGPVEQREPVGEQRPRVTGPGGLPFPRVQFAQRPVRRRPGPAGPSAARPARRVPRRAVPATPDRGEPAVGRPEGTEELGEGGGGTRCRRRGAPRRGRRRGPRRGSPRPRRGRRCRRTGRGRTRSRGGRSYDDVEGSSGASRPRRCRPRRRPPARRGPAGTEIRARAARSARSCPNRRADGEQGGAEDGRVEGEPAPRWVRGLRSSSGAGRCGPGRSAGRAGGAGRAGRAPRRGGRRRRRPYRSTASVKAASRPGTAAHGLPGAEDPGVVDVVHQPGAGLPASRSAASEAPPWRSRGSRPGPGRGAGSRPPAVRSSRGRCRSGAVT